MINAIIDSNYGILFLQVIICAALSFAIQFIFMRSDIAIAHVFGFATVMATAASYTDDGGKLSLPDLFSSVRTKWRSSFRSRTNIRGSTGSRNLMHFLPFVAVAVAVPVVVLNPNPVTITIASAVGVSIFVFHFYASVASELAAVIWVVEVEEGCEVAEAVEKAEKLVEGQRLQGYMINSFFNIVDLIVLLSFWMILGDLGSVSLNVTVYVLIYLNCAAVTRTFVNVAYTVCYFRCKEYHGQKIQQLGDFNYTTLPTHIP